ncbi:MAG: hypothetical protein WCP57_09500 [Bacteroidota bacterium]
MQQHPVSLGAHFKYAFNEIKQNNSLIWYIIAFIHIDLSIYIAQNLYIAHNTQKLFFIFYILLTVQLLLQYYHQKYWKHIYLILLSLFLLFSVFLVRIVDTGKIVWIKNIYQQEATKPNKHANKEVHSFI